MNSKTLVEDYPALVESRLLGSKAVSDKNIAKIVVNPTNALFYNKTVIINLPIEIPLEQLMQFNEVISRFPTGYDNIKVISYELPKIRSKLNKTDYSLLILTKEIVKDLDYAEVIEEGHFLIGVDEVIEDKASLIGYLLLRSEIENL